MTAVTTTAVLPALCTSAQSVRAGDSRLPPAGRATPSPRTGDFNGDGYDDFAAVMQGRRVVVVDGTAHGLDPQLRTVSQLPSRKEHMPETQLLRADLDHDGYTDLVHAPSGREPAVQWGGSRGLSTAQTLAGAPGDLRINGHFDGDGAADLSFGGDTTTAGTVRYGPDPVPPSRNRAARMRVAEPRRRPWRRRHRPDHPPVASRVMGLEIDVVVGYPTDDEVEKVLGLAEAVGEPVTVTFLWEGREEAERVVLVPAATLALWEHWAPTAHPARGAAGENGASAQEPELAHPAEFGAFTLFRRRAGGRTAVARSGVVVAELLDPDEARRLQEGARDVRQGFMDPKQKAAFEEFLARQASLDEQ